METEQITGVLSRSDGMADGPTRVTRQLAQVVADGHSRYYEETFRRQMWSLTLTATTTGVAAGNLLAAGAAASTNFAVWNPVISPVVLVLVKFGMGIISGTAGAGPLFHGLLVDSVPTIGSNGTARCNYASATPAPNAKFVSSAGGTALTGGSAPVALRLSSIGTEAAAQTAAGAFPIIEELAGDIVLPPGTGWLPLWSAAGTSLLTAYSLQWAEVPV